MRRKEEVIESERYSQILFAIAGKSKNYNQAISKTLNIKPNALIEHLKYLEKNKYTIPSREKIFNRKLYFINWEKINEEFFDFLKKEVIEEYKNYKKVFPKADLEFCPITEAYEFMTGQTGEFKFFTKENIIKSEILKRIFKKSFEIYSVYDVKPTLKKVFQQIIITFSNKIFSDNERCNEPNNEKYLEGFKESSLDIQNMALLEHISYSLTFLISIEDAIWDIKEDFLNEYINKQETRRTEFILEGSFRNLDRAIKEKQESNFDFSKVKFWAVSISLNVNQNETELLNKMPKLLNLFFGNMDLKKTKSLCPAIEYKKGFRKGTYPEPFRVYYTTEELTEQTDKHLAEKLKKVFPNVNFPNIKPVYAIEIKEQMERGELLKIPA
jgi:hypothetical protein